ncbi:cobalamin B12-binding domain-containing protein [Acuticoccus sp.]|uniref:cobalamin B12-binding domain-containing protein n=1 Tax=Acuticoccus sp. TaxID=1904378 RepID=UPI003B5237B8
MAGTTGLQVSDRPQQLNLVGRSVRRSPGDELDRPARLDHFAALTQTIEGEIIPRLLMVHSRDATALHRPTCPRPILPEDVAAFADLVIARGPQDCIVWTELVRQQGAELEVIFLDLFAATARRLGEMWTQDVRSFADVTIGLGTLQQVFRHFSPAFDRVDCGPRPRRAFLVPSPGEQHTFGLFLVEAFLHRAGWHVDALPTYDAGEVSAYLKSNPVDLVGVSASCERFLEGTRRAVALVRRETADRPVTILAGGKPFNTIPARVGEVGADASAVDAHEAVHVAEQLVPLVRGDASYRRIN